MVPGRAEGVLADEPAGREDDEVGDGGAGAGGRGGEDGEDGGVRVVEGDGADGVEAVEVVFEGIVGSVPGHHVEGGVCLDRLVQGVGELARDGVV